MQFKNIIVLTIFITCFSLAQETSIKLRAESLEFPVITADSNDELYVGEVTKIKQNIEDRKQFFTQATAYLNTKEDKVSLQITSTLKQLQKDENNNVIDNLINQEVQKTLTKLKAEQEKNIEIKNSFKDIHYKYVNLLQELEKPNEILNTLNLEQPYTIESINRLNDFIEEMQQSQLNLQSLDDTSTKRLNNLSNIINDAIVEYTILFGQQQKPLEIFNLIRNIYLYQTEFAILKFKSSKYTQQLTHTIARINEKKKLFPTVVESVQIDENSIDEIRENIKNTEQQYNQLIEEHEKLNDDFDEQSLKFELELDNLESKIKNSDNQATIELLQLQKQLNLNKVQYSYFIKNLLQQKQQELQVKLTTYKFQLAWLSAYDNKETKPKQFKKIIKTWQTKLSEQLELETENNQLLDSLNRSTLEISRLQQQASEKDNASEKYKKQQNLLSKQLDKSLKTIQRLSLQINNNNNTIQLNDSKNKRVLSLLSLQLNKIELIGQWFGDRFKSQVEKIKSFIYFPLASFGDRPFTFGTILTILLYFILGFTLLRFFRKRLTSVLEKRAKLSEGASHSIATLLYYLGAFLIILASLSTAGFNLGQMMLVFGALGVGIGFGLQNIANNFISGMILLIDRTLTVGDSITLNDGVHGKVQKLAMRYTVIRTNGGYDIIVPNSELIANRVTSMTFADNYLRIEIPFGVSYASDPQQVKEITLEVANKVKHTINRENQKSVVIFNGMGDNSLDFILRVWVFIYDRYRPYAIKSDYYYKLFKAFKEAGIEIPFPQRDLHIRSIDKDILKAIKSSKLIDTK